MASINKKSEFKNTGTGVKDVTIINNFILNLQLTNDLKRFFKSVEMRLTYNYMCIMG